MASATRTGCARDNNDMTFRVCVCVSRAHTREQVQHYESAVIIAMNLRVWVVVVVGGLYGWLPPKAINAWN